MKTLRAHKKKLIVGLTGGFGTGKTTVARLLKRRGAEIVDADRCARDILKRGSPVYRKIAQAFGPEVITGSGVIDRARLASAVFNNKQLLGRLNALVHPAVVRQMKEAVSLSTARVVVLDVPLLFEAGLDRMVDAVIVVTAPLGTQIERVGRRMKMKRPDILKRIHCQIPLKQKAEAADFVIDNGGDIEETKKQVVKVWKELTE